LIPHDMMYGPQAALIAESFTGRLRYSGASLGYQLASIIAGGPAPLIATAIFARTHSGQAIAVYVCICGLISLIATSMLRDYTNKDISAEPPIPPARAGRRWQWREGAWDACVRSFMAAPRRAPAHAPRDCCVCPMAAAVEHATDVLRRRIP